MYRLCFPLNHLEKKMTEKKNKVYWVEGVTANEVENSLNDSRYNYLRTRKARRALVVLFVVLLGLSIGTGFVSTDVGNYLLMASVAGMILVYIMLRTSIRQIADAPDELIDERQQRIRDNAYLVSYRILAAGLSVPLVAFLLWAEWSDWNVEAFTDSSMTGIVLAYMFLIATLPSAVIAWGEKGE
jgi:hypothetical protein